MTSRNDITGDELKSRTNNDKYRDGWDRIFGNNGKSAMLRIAKDLLRENSVDYNLENIKESSITYDNNNKSTLIQIFVDITPAESVDLTNNLIDRFIEKDLDLANISVVYVGTKL